MVQLIYKWFLFSNASNNNNDDKKNLYNIYDFKESNAGRINKSNNNN